uniref:Chloride channel protein n=2 Tax=Hirondellea gigas TaxID=1518452 RepID=A0A6A7G5D9_9CRUS
MNAWTPLLHFKKASTSNGTEGVEKSNNYGSNMDRASSSDGAGGSGPYERMPSPPSPPLPRRRRKRQHSNDVRRRRRSHGEAIPVIPPPPDVGLQPRIPAKERGSMYVIDQTYESLDYDTCPNELYMRERLSTSTKAHTYVAVLRMTVAGITGALTAVVAVLIDVVIHYGAMWKFKLLQRYMSNSYNPAVPILLWVTLNCAFTLPAAILGSVVEPVAAGSGIPQVKCYLNGVKIPRVVRIKTLFCKAVGVICSVLGGLLVGKEGPMIHSGAVIAAGISQGKSSTFNKDFHFFQRFREDPEKRDFVACGSAAGVAAAFGAPIGGVLFALEEGASHWQQMLTWNSFVAAGCAVGILNVMLSMIYGRKSGGLLNFGEFLNMETAYFEYVIFFVMAVCTAIISTLFNFVNQQVTIRRMRYLTKPWMRIVEALLVSSVTALTSSAHIYISPDCKVPSEERPSLYPVQLTCPAGQESMTARLYMETPEGALVNLFHDPYGMYSVHTLVVHFLVTTTLSCITYGIGVPSGLFIPTLLNGASFGRLFGVGMTWLMPSFSGGVANEGKYALIGAAAFLGGVVRMTLSLTCIIMESTGAVTFTIPLLMVIYIAKYIGDIFNKGLYDIHIRLTGVPFLEPKAEPPLENLSAADVMSSPAICLHPVESVRRLLVIARQCTHNGFPVVWDMTVPFVKSSSNRRGSGQQPSRKTDADDRDSSSSSNRQSSVESNRNIEDVRINMTVNNVDCERESDVEDEDHYNENDIVELIQNADAFDIKNHCAKLNKQEGLDSETLHSRLLTDSCINRFSKAIVSSSSMTDSACVVNSVDESDVNDGSIREVEDDVSITFEDGATGDKTVVDPPGQSQFYDTTNVALDFDLESTEVDSVQGTLCGLMLRSQIMVMLKHKMFIEREEYWSDSWQDLGVFRDAYPRFYDLEAVDLRPEDLDCHVDLRPYMNPTPYTTTKQMNLSRTYDNFRKLGLRHQVVVDNSFQAKGIITRKDLVKFHAKEKDGAIVIERMNVYESVTA